MLCSPYVCINCASQWESALVGFTDDGDDEERVPITEFPDITADEIRRVELQEALMDSQRYQRENVDESYRLLGIVNPTCLRMPGMSNSQTFTFWQSLAVSGIYEMLEFPC